MSPYQIADITVRDSGTNAVLVQTSATVPTSDEFNCAKCHAPAARSASSTSCRRQPTTDRDDASQDHPGGLRPVLCASCHGSPALGQTGPGTSGIYLSRAIHGYHASRGATCYDCHPGQIAKCNRSTAHTAADGNCIACHGTLEDVASSIADGRADPLGERAPVRDLPPRRRRGQHR